MKADMSKLARRTTFGLAAVVLILQFASAQADFFKSDQWGGPHGSSFDDSTDITENEDLKRISIRTGKRVDQVAFATTSHSLIHGGGGGSESSLEIDSDDRVKQFDCCLGKMDGHTRLFYIRFVMQKGKILEGGTITTECITYVIPYGMYVIGMHGRSGEEVDKLGLVMKPSLVGY